MSAPQLSPISLSSLGRDKCSVGCTVLDFFLSGGVPCGLITEFCGESTAAKSQLCMQLLLHVQLPKKYGGLSGSAVYVYTEGEPAIKRLQELASLLKFKYPPDALADIPDPLANIFIERGFDSGQDVLSCLHRIRKLLQEPRERPVRLIVVDSIAHVFRDVGDKPGIGELAGRTELLFRISSMLRRYAHDHSLAVVVSNQVGDALGPSGSGSGTAAGKNVGHTGGMRMMSGGRELIPALGLAWANCVNTRVFMLRQTLPGSSEPVLFYGPLSSPARLAAAATGSMPASGPPVLRRMQIMWSPHMEVNNCCYIVEQTGVRALHPREFDSLPADQNPYHGQQQQRQQQRQQAMQQQQGLQQQQGQQTLQWQEQQQQGPSPPQPQQISKPQEQGSASSSSTVQPVPLQPLTAGGMERQSASARLESVAQHGQPLPSQQEQIDGAAGRPSWKLRSRSQHHQQRQQQQYWQSA